MSTTTPDTTVATAINSVLEAEREVADAVARAQAEAQIAIDAAREARRNILERARLRIGRVREIAQRKLAAQIAALEHDESTLSVDDAAVTTAGDAAIARLTERLTTQDSA
jgi:F0F1-type ATP synthase membrane subunit b/b'